MKLLRVMSEERAFERVGGNQTLRADVRLIAATNKNLEKFVREGKFRDDLFFRLNVVRITMPPLRERKEDIPLLVRGFLRHFSKVNDKPLLDLTADAMNALLSLQLAGQRSRAPHRDRAWRRDGHRAKDYFARSADGCATGSPSELPGGVSPLKPFGKRRARSICTRQKKD